MYEERNTGVWRFARSKIVLFLLIVLIALIGNATVNMYGRYREAHIRANRAQEELRLLTERKGALSADLERLSTERGTEEELRKRFNVAGEGEGVIVIVDPREKGTDDDSSQRRTVWEKILQFLGE